MSGFDRIPFLRYTVTVFISHHHTRMILVCPECKNQVNLSAYPNVEPDQVVECDTCGISLLVVDIAGEEVKTEIVDEGK